MRYVTDGLEPKTPLRIFEDICMIPHGSGNEDGVAEYIMNFASSRGLYNVRDEAGNVFVRKGNIDENTNSVLLQGHMDMVCEKNAGVEHDFTRDGLKLVLKDGYLSAEGTTLGADDGIAVAYMLSLLDENTRPLELLFTVEEETGLEGAKKFDCSCIRSKQMINLDSEEENALTAGCAGGVRTDIMLPVERGEGRECVRVKIGGLFGGHSGADINLGRTSAVSIAGILLALINDRADILIHKIVCAGKDNAIARECEFYICPAEQENDFYDCIKKIVNMAVAQIRKFLSEDDKNLTVECEMLSDTVRPCDKQSTGKIIALLNLLRVGVLKMSNDIKGLVEYSRNLGIVETTDGEVKLSLSSRSALEFQIDMSVRELDLIAKLSGAEIKHYARYPGWEYEPKSELREKYISSYKALYKKEPAVGVIHAGLECGILSSKLCNMDIISVGPDILDIHSPAERLDIASFGRVYEILKQILKP